MLWREVAGRKECAGILHVFEGQNAKFIAMRANPCHSHLAHPRPLGTDGLRMCTVYTDARAGHERMT